MGKKILRLVTFITLLVPSLIFVQAFEYAEVKDIVIGKDRTTVHDLQFDGAKKDKVAMLKDIDAAAVESGVSMGIVGNVIKLADGTDKIRIYLGQQTPRGQDRILKRLVSGRFFSKWDTNPFISSENTHAPNQIGRIRIFGRTLKIELRPLLAIFEKGDYFHSFHVNTKDTQKLKVFENNLKKRGLIKCKFSTNTAVNASDSGHTLPSVMRFLLILLFLAYLYSMFFSFKSLAIKKSVGFSNIKIRQQLVIETAVNCLWCLCGVWIVNLLWIAFFKNLGCSLAFWGQLALFHAIYVSLILFVVLISTCILPMVKIDLMVKNKKPMQFIRVSSYSIKFAFLVILVLSLCGGLDYARYLATQKKIQKKWESFSCYFKTIERDMWADDEAGFSPEITKDTNELWCLRNKKGSLYIDTTSYTLDHIERQEQTWRKDNQIHKICPYGEYRAITVNNNYLKQNPIYGLDNKQIDIPDHWSYDTTLLVPVFMKEYHNEIQKEYKKGGIAKDAKVNIVYVKDGQSYFSLNSLLDRKLAGEIRDPIAIVASYKNIPAGLISCATTHSIYHRICDPENAMHELESDLRQSGMYNHIFGIRSAYDEVVWQIRTIKNDFVMIVFDVIAEFIAFAMLIVLITSNYSERNRIKNAIKKLTGEPFLRSHWIFFILLLSFWPIIYLLPLGMGNSGSSATSNGVFFTLLGLDLLLSSILLRISEARNLNNVLKGE
ncbi:MAG: DUF1430 domain-containing protein [Oscillospiraceae bacterium]|jgi:hypothetical protein|nr:DUF1430 domain-containing protein [Oscillospiraceae bacterium]